MNESSDRPMVKKEWQRQNGPVDNAFLGLHTGTSSTTTEVEFPASSLRWVAKPIASQATVIDLVEAYIEVVYPMCVLLRFTKIGLCAYKN